MVEVRMILHQALVRICFSKLPIEFNSCLFVISPHESTDISPPPHFWADFGHWPVPSGGLCREHAAVYSRGRSGVGHHTLLMLGRDGGSPDA